MVPEGRIAFIYIRMDDAVIEVEVEYSGAQGYDVILNSEGLAWQIDARTLERRVALRAASSSAKQSLEAWLASKGWRYMYFPAT